MAADFKSAGTPSGLPPHLAENTIFRQKYILKNTIFLENYIIDLKYKDLWVKITDLTTI